jgi:hypothetical protein
VNDPKDELQATGEAERLYQHAKSTRDAAAIENAIAFHQRLGEIIPTGHLDRGFELAIRIRELRSWTPR